MNKINQSDSIIHFTSEDSLIKILKSKWLYNQIDRQRNTVCSVGEGNLNRIAISAHANIKPDHKYEAIGVYFRLWLNNTKFFPKYKESSIGLELSTNILNNVRWHLNTCENNGFVIKNNKAPWGDCENDIYTLYDLDSVDINDYNIYGYGYELIIEESINIGESLLTIYFNDEKTYELMKEIVNNLGYNAVLI